MSYGSQQTYPVTAASSLSGSATPLDSRAIPVNQDTVAHFVGLINEQSMELRHRSAVVASRIAGLVPEAVVPKEGDPPTCLLECLRQISQTLSHALSEAERAERSL